MAAGAMDLVLSTAKPISAMSLSRQMGIQYRTCWHLPHRLRAMLAGGERLPLSGIVEADEAYVGGVKPRGLPDKAENLPKSALRPGKRGRGTTKPMLFAAIQRGSEARTLAIPSASAAAIAPAFWDWTGGAATLMTDELGTYRWIGRKGLARTQLAKSFTDAGLGGDAAASPLQGRMGGAGVARAFPRPPQHGRLTVLRHLRPETAPFREGMGLRDVRRGPSRKRFAFRRDRDVAAAWIILSRAVGAACPEPAGAARRKRGAAVRGEVRAKAQASHGGPPANVAGGRI